MFGNVAILVCLVAVTTITAFPRQSEMEIIEMQENFEKGGHYQGDMRFLPGEDTRNGLVHPNYRWPDNTVYYEIDPVFTNQEKNIIIGALNEIQSTTCIRFVPRTNQANYVYVQSENSGCWSYVGKINGKQLLNLASPGCVYHRTAMHEFLHALGFHHQHSAIDRDDFVEILLENVRDEYQYAYDKYGPDRITDFGVGYDYESVMHYNQFAFSKNGKNTIITNDASMQTIIGTIPALSKKDILKINLMYNC